MMNERYRQYLQNFIDAVNDRQKEYLYALNPNGVICYTKTNYDTVINVMHWKEFVEQYWQFLKDVENSHHLMAWVLGSKKQS